MNYRLYRNTETKDIWALTEVEKPYLCGINTGMSCKLQLVCTSDFRNPMDIMDRNVYDNEKGFESFNAYVFSEGIDAAAEANDYELIGDYEKVKLQAERGDRDLADIVGVIRAFYKSRYGVDY